MKTNVAEAQVTKILVNYVTSIYPTHEWSTLWYEGWNWREALIHYLNRAWSGYEHGGTIRLQLFTGTCEAEKYDSAYIARTDCSAVGSQEYTLYPTENLLTQSDSDLGWHLKVSDETSTFAEIDVALMRFVKDDTIHTLSITFTHSRYELILQKGSKPGELRIATRRPDPKK